MRYFLALLPILVVLALMIRLRWGAHKAGVAGWLAGLAVAWLGFGLTLQILLVSQAKGLLLSVFVLAVMWPALFLYHWNDRNGGIMAVARLLERAMPNRGMCLILLAWSLSGLLEGLAGFGLPIAVVAPMLVALGVSPLKAVAATAIGHCWAVTFGDMGVILQTLTAVTGLDGARLVPWAAFLLGVATLLCGLGAAAVLGELRQWPKVMALSGVIAGVQYGLAAVGLLPLSAFGAGLAGLLVYMGAARLCRKYSEGSSAIPLAGQPHHIPRGSVAAGRLDEGAEDQIVCEEEGHRLGLRSRIKSKKSDCAASSGSNTPAPIPAFSPGKTPALLTIATYGALTLIMAALTMIGPLRAWVNGIVWKASFPEVVSRTHFATPAGSGQVFRPLAHPGTLILVAACLSIAFWGRDTGKKLATIKAAACATWKSAWAATLGVISMVGLSALMDHCEMSYVLAAGLSQLLGAVYPVVSPAVGILGAFATGSNNSSNVLFGSLQKNVALFLHLNPFLLVAAQTAGGSLGSMLAPVKIILGCSTVGLVEKEGQVLRQTVPCGLLIGLLLGLLTLALSWISR